jgi:soluble lytic murein transglycosylase-like protein
MKEKIVYCLLTCVFVLSSSSYSYAEDKYTPDEIDLIIEYASQKYDIPKELILLIGESESSQRHWVVNFGGDAHIYENQDDMISAIEHSFARNYDVGFMQINSFWIRKYGFDLKDITDPYYNIMMGAWILRDCINRYGNNMQALIAYHTNPKNVELGERYARLLLRNAPRVLTR